MKKRRGLKTEHRGFQILSGLEKEENLAEEIEMRGNPEDYGVPEAKRGKYLRRRTCSIYVQYC